MHSCYFRPCVFDADASDMLEFYRDERAEIQQRINDREEEIRVLQESIQDEINALYKQINDKRATIRDRVQLIRSEITLEHQKMSQLHEKANEAAREAWEQFELDQFMDIINRVCMGKTSSIH